jgi:hypothetical protein
MRGTLVQNNFKSQINKILGKRRRGENPEEESQGDIINSEESND